jgi:hypothetical protein
MPENTIIEVDLAIADLRQHILAGTANGQIAVVQLLQLNEKRDQLIHQFLNAKTQIIAL